MEVVDISESDISKYLKDLVFSIRNEIESYRDIHIIGIASAGVPIAEELYRIVGDLVGSGGAKRHLSIIRCQRPSTKMKKKNFATEFFLSGFFYFIPKSALNYFRILEHDKLKKRRTSDVARKIELDDALIISDESLVMLVDDAVDSGVSMLKVKEYIESISPSSSLIKTISIALTQENSIFTPDFVMKKNVLVRFPWSLDAK